MLNSMIDKCNALFEQAAKERHIVILRESLQKLLVFWVCIGVSLLLAKYATSYPMGQLSSIAIMIITTFLLPLLNLFFFKWLLAELFQIKLAVPDVVKYRKKKDAQHHALTVHSVLDEENE